MFGAQFSPSTPVISSSSSNSLETRSPVVASNLNSFFTPLHRPHRLRSGECYGCAISTAEEICNFITLCAAARTPESSLSRSIQSEITQVTTRVGSMKLSPSETNDLFAHIRNALHSYQSPLGHPSEARRWCLTVVIDGAELCT